MKRDISWHKQCLANIRAGLRNKESQLIRAQEEFLNLRGDIEFYNKQIQEAEGKKKDGFDRLKFLVKRNKGEITCQ